MRHFIYPLAALAALGTVGLASAKALATSADSPAFAGHRYAPQAKVPLAQARDTALKAQPGVITDEELEREHGGSGLRYSFDVKSAKGVTYEIGVDAKTGAVLEHSLEGPNAD
ncbi:MAG TPA: PepSY domain-containing protein [Caulobacteraceae bacterium]|nr:PepSY domain-containing protein [Caulobacteraceae bacterium]